MRLRAAILVGLSLFCICKSAIAQKNYHTHVFLDGEEQEEGSFIDLRNQKKDSLSNILILDQLVKAYLAQSFLESSIDSIKYNDSIATAYIHRGPMYEFAQFQVDSLYRETLALAGYRLEDLKGKPLNMIYVGEMFENIIQILENNGYPFSNISFRDYRIEDSKFEGSLHIDKGRMITMDTFNLYGLNVISKSYLYNYLQINPGDAYNSQMIFAVKEKVNNLPFLQLKADPSIRFIGNKAILNLNLQEKNASRIDFIIGVLPRPGDQQGFTITGDVNFEIQNKLKEGEQLAVKYERLKPETQRLEIRAQYPYLANLPFGLDLDFSLFRNVNQNQDLNFSFGVLYQLKANNFLKAFWNTQSSRLIQIDSAQILGSFKLPSRLDVSVRNFGLQFNYLNLDYRFNPRKGYNIILRGTAGQKQILTNNNILGLRNESVDFSNAYDSLDLSSYQFKFTIDSKFFFPIQKRGTFLTSIYLSKIFAEQKVYENEYRRFGGNKLMRGFDEESLQAEFLAVATLEYRLLLTRNSFVSAFFDYGIKQDKYDLEYEWDRPVGFGGGFSFETAVGIIGMSVGVGAQKGNGFDFVNPKTHIGLLSLF